MFAEFEVACELKWPDSAFVCALRGAFVAFGVSARQWNVPGLHLVLTPH